MEHIDSLKKIMRVPGISVNKNVDFRTRVIGVGGQSPNPLDYTRNLFIKILVEYITKHK